MNPGLYIHVPFCVRKCPYCDFYSTEDVSRLGAYKDALIREMAMRAAAAPCLPFDTVHIGGGTPSVIDVSSLEQILKAAYSNFNILSDAEITMEANPGTIAADTLSDYRSAGVNRINIGVQSFNDANLSFLGRIHSAAQALQALRSAEKAGFENIGLDLIYGLPGQQMDSWQKDLAAAADFSPAHISCYMLTIEEGTKMAADMDEGIFIPLCEELVSAMFARTSQFLSSRGYRHYEISNFAVSDKARSAHNQKYWKNAPYIGLGPAAHSYVEPQRSWNTENLDQYISALFSDRLPEEKTECLSLSQMMIEAVYLGLRQSDGINIMKFEQRFGKNFNEMFAPALQRFTSSGHIQLDGRTCSLTLEGMLFIDTIVKDLISRIP